MSKKVVLQHASFLALLERYKEEPIEIPFDEKLSQVEQFVPVTDKLGNLLTVGMKVDFEPIQADFRSFSPEFMLKSGNVAPLASYPPSAFRILEMSNQLNLKPVEL